MSGVGGQLPEDDLYDLAPAAPAAPVAAADKRPPLTAKPAAPAPVVPLSYGSPRLRTEQSPYEAEELMNLRVPLWLLGGGVVIEIFGAFFMGPNFQAATIALSFQLLVGTIVKLLGILIVARLLRINFGPFWQAVLKLAAIDAACGAVAVVAHPLVFFPLGFLPVMVLEFVAFFALLGALFNLEHDEIWTCVGVFFVLNLGLYFLLQRVA